MRMIVGFAALVVALAAFSGSAAAVDKCAIDEDAAVKAGGFAPAVTTAIKNAWSCAGAYQILETCQLGSSANNALSDIVLSKCEPMFMPKASPAVKADYQKARDKCTKIAEKGDGSMAQGFAAVCLGKAARDFARKYPNKR